MEDTALAICKEKILNFTFQKEMILLKEDIEYKSWKIDREIYLYNPPSKYKWNWKDHFNVKLIDSMGDSKTFPVYYVIGNLEYSDWIKNALLEIFNRSEFDYANWKEYKAKGEELKTEIKNLTELLNRKLDYPYILFDILPELDKKIKEWAIYMNDNDIYRNPLADFQYTHFLNK